MFIFCVLCVCYAFFLGFRLSVPVQSIAWKDSSPKWPIMCREGCKTLPYHTAVQHHLVDVTDCFQAASQSELFLQCFGADCVWWCCSAWLSLCIMLDSTPNVSFFIVNCSCSPRTYGTLIVSDRCWCRTSDTGASAVTGRIGDERATALRRPMA